MLLSSRMMRVQVSMLMSLCHMARVVHGGLVRSAIAGKGRAESSLPDLFPTDAERLRGNPPLNPPMDDPGILNDAETPSFEEINPVQEPGPERNNYLRWIFHQNFFNSDYSNWFVELDNLTPEKRSKIKESWFKNQEQVEALYRDSFSRSQSLDLLRELVRYINNNLDEAIEDTSGAARFHTQNLMEVVRRTWRIHRQLNVWEKLRYAQLAEIDLSVSNQKIFDLLFSECITNAGGEAPVNFPLPKDLVMNEIYPKYWGIFETLIANELESLVHSFPRSGGGEEAAGAGPPSLSTSRLPAASILSPFVISYIFDSSLLLN